MHDHRQDLVSGRCFHIRLERQSPLEKKLHIGFPGGSPSPKRNKGIIPKILQVQGCIGCLGEFRTAQKNLLKRYKEGFLERLFCVGRAGNHCKIHKSVFQSSKSFRGRVTGNP